MTVVELWHMYVGVFLRIDTGVILIGDAISTNQRLVLDKLRGVKLETGLWENYILNFHEFYTARVWMKAN